MKPAVPAGNEHGRNADWNGNGEIHPQKPFAVPPPPLSTTASTGSSNLSKQPSSSVAGADPKAKKAVAFQTADGADAAEQPETGAQGNSSENGGSVLSNGAPPKTPEELQRSLSGKDVLGAVKSASNDWKTAALETVDTFKMMVLLPFEKDPVSLTLDQVLALIFFVCVAFWLLFIRWLRPALLSTFGSTLLGLGFGLGVSFLFYKNKRRKLEINQVLGVNLGMKGVQHLLGALPSWFSYTEREKLEWLNSLLVEVWPFYDKGVCAMIKDIAAKEIPKLLEQNKAIGTAVKKLYFKHLTFGEAPIRIETLWVSQQTDACVMEVEARWCGDPNITLAVELAGGEKTKLCPRVTDISFVATLRITLQPLVDRVPGFVAAVINFKKPPMIKYRLDFGSALGGSYTAGLVTPVINAIIKDVMIKMLVWPQRLVIPVIQETEEDKLEAEKLYLRSKGLLKIEVLKAKDLKAKDINGKSDPVIEFTTDNDHMAETTTKKMTLAPEWNETLYVLVQEPTNQDMRVIMSDVDLFKPTQILTGKIRNMVHSKELMGRALVKMKTVTAMEPEPYEGWFHLGLGDWSNPGGPGKGEGKVMLRMTYRSFENVRVADAREATKGILIVRIVNIKNLPKTMITKGMYVYLKARVGKHEGWESVARPCTTQDLDFRLPPTGSNFYNVSDQDMIKIKLVEKSLLMSDEALGRLEVPVSEVAESNDVNIFTRSPEAGYYHRTVELDESDGATIDVILRWVPHF